MKLWIILIVIALLVAPQAFAHPGDAPNDATSSDTATSPVGDEADEREAIVAWLAHYHKIPDRRQFEEISDDARDIIFELAQDNEALAFYRRRAMKALTNWPTQQTYDYLVDVLHDEDTDDGLRHHLLVILADGFGDKALDELEPFLFDADDPQLRISAGNAISQISGDRAYEMIVDALHAEEHPVVQARLEQFAPRVR